MSLALLVMSEASTVAAFAARRAVLRLASQVVTAMVTTCACANKHAKDNASMISKIVCV